MPTTCYWQHETGPEARYTCLDGRSPVCPRCCVDYYLAFHGKPAAIKSVLDGIGADRLCDAFRGYGRCGYDNLVYFAACSVLRGRRGHRFAREFLQASGCRAVIGYTTDVNWMASLVTDLLFLHRFYSDPDPWRNLRAIFASVQRDFRPARELGHTLVLADST